MKTRLNIVMVVALLAMVPAFGAVPAVQAQDGVCTVTGGADFGEGSLRALVADDACSTIDFDGPHTIRLGSALTLGRNLTIDGGTYDVVISGDTGGEGTGDVQIFVVSSGVAVTLKNLTLEKGRSAANGGAVYSQGTLNVEGCAFSGNSAAYNGGAVYSDAGSLAVTGSTFSGNSSSAGAWGGGAICSLNDSSVQVTNSTFSGNSTALSSEGGALFLHSISYGVSATLTNNTFAANTGGAIEVYEGAQIGLLTLNNNLIATGGDPSACNLSGPSHYAQGSNNLTDGESCVDGGYGDPFGTVVDSLLLGTLGDYGGNTQTIPLLPGSPAIDAGDDVVCPANDQRGVTRPQDGDGDGTAACDIGAYEVAAGSLPGITTQPLSQSVFVGDVVSLSADATGDPSPAVQWQVSSDGGTTWSDIDGATSATYSFTASYDQNGTQFRAVFTNSEGSATSNAAILTVSKRDATCTITGWSGTYDGSPHGAGGTCTGVDGATLSGLDLGATFTGVPGGTAHWTFTDVTGNYSDQTGTADIVIGKADAACTITGWTGTYDGSPHGACGTCTGVNGEALSGLDLGATFTDVPGGTALWTYTDITGNYGDQSGDVQIVIDEANTAPAANPGGPYLGAVNTTIPMDGSGSSDTENDTLTYAWDLGDGSGSTETMPSHSYTAAGIYDVCLTVNDGTVDSDLACTLAVVYDPDGGFVTGGGWIDSPVNQGYEYMQVGGKATFGFVSKYKKGASVPEGTTGFQFQAGGFNFYSDSYDWLVVDQSGTNAQFKGSGTVNGALDPNGNAYKFMIWATDSAPDAFRIKVWWECDDGVENVVYDNGFNQAIGGGNIVVHTK